MDKKIIVAIDGHASCGKSTFAKMIAKELGYIYIDSGAMYRAVTLYSLRQGFTGSNGTDRESIIKELSSISIRFSYNADTGGYETYLNNENVEDEIRSIEISGYVSEVSRISEVRKRMVELQREIGVFKGIVMDGRDIGTVVFPDADIKIFLTASVEVRAMRRFLELKEKGVEANLEEIKSNIEERDRMDSSREISPLIKAEDALLLDNSNMTPERQMSWFRELLKKKGS
ncbi:MAG: (d)CMP kinase [Bacteroidales bacterium]|nr:(d)CMP kinase [Bacteroidales bacterium]